MSKPVSKHIIVLTPNGRRQNVHCTPDTTILQILEEACEKQGFQPTDYDLKHHKHILDLTITVRFSNLPNKATLEMVEVERKREEKNVTIGLMLEDGDRRTADFAPNTCLLDLITKLAPTEFDALQQPTIMYMRQEVTGVPALKEKTLRQLGLLGGRAILRLFNKTETDRQANVSAVYHCPLTNKSEEKVESQPDIEEAADVDNKIEMDKPGPSVPLIKENKQKEPQNMLVEEPKHTNAEAAHDQQNKGKSPRHSQDNKSVKKSTETKLKIDETSTTTSVTHENKQSNQNIEEEVIYLGSQKAVAFMLNDDEDDHLSDLPDDFYDLSVEEVRKLYKELQQQRMELEESPLQTSSMRVDHNQKESQQKLAGYKNVVVRVQFPDRMILQGIFLPTNTIQDVLNFIKEYLSEPNEPFHIFTVPLKSSLDPAMTLLDAKFVPCVLMHFKWLHDNKSGHCLKKEIHPKLTTREVASIIAAKYRSLSRRKMNEESDDSNTAGTSSAPAKSSKLPKWFKR